MIGGVHTYLIQMSANPFHLYIIYYYYLLLYYIQRLPPQEHDNLKTRGGAMQMQEGPKYAKLHVHKSPKPYMTWKVSEVQCSAARMQYHP